MKDPVRYSEYPWTLIANESPSPSAVWVGVIDHLCALYNQFCKMAIERTQIVFIGRKTLPTLHHVAVVAVTGRKGKASNLVSIGPLGSPLVPWVTSIKVAALGRSSILIEHISPSHSKILEVTTYVRARFFRCRIVHVSIVHLRLSLLPCFIKKLCARRIMDFFLDGRFPTVDGWDGSHRGVGAYGLPGEF